MVLSTEELMEQNDNDKFKSVDLRQISATVEEYEKQDALIFGFELLALDTREVCGEPYRHGGRGYWGYGMGDQSLIVSVARS